MTTHSHAVLWIDHKEAKVIFFNADDATEEVVHSHRSGEHIHSRSGSPSGTHLTADDAYLRGVAERLEPARAILVTGPSEAKGEFIHYIEKHARQLMPRVSAVKALQRVTDKQLVAEARHHFKVADRMAPRVETPVAGH